MRERRIVVATGEGGGRSGFYLPRAAEGATIEIAEDLGQALRKCLEAPCEALYVPLLAPDGAALTSLAVFRAMRPRQKVVLVVDRALRGLVEPLGLADAIETIDT